MAEVDPRLVAALEVQLEAWRRAVGAGAERVGWKLGLGDRERIGRGPVIGHLTSATQLTQGSTYRAGATSALHADAEIALEIGRDVDPDAHVTRAGEAIVAYGAALELVDLGGTDDAEQVVATNVFHRAFALGPFRAALPGGIEGRLVVDGHVRAEGPASGDFAQRVRVVARQLGALGERLEAGDRIITGSVVQVPVAAGEHVDCDFGALGRVDLHVES